MGIYYRIGDKVHCAPSGASQSSVRTAALICKRTESPNVQAALHKVTTREDSNALIAAASMIVEGYEYATEVGTFFAPDVVVHHLESTISSKPMKRYARGKPGKKGDHPEPPAASMSRLTVLLPAVSSGGTAKSDDTITVKPDDTSTTGGTAKKEKSR
jgi:hypothetical protein